MFYTLAIFVMEVRFFQKFDAILAFSLNLYTSPVGGSNVNDGVFTPQVKPNKEEENSWKLFRWTSGSHE